MDKVLLLNIDEMSLTTPQWVDKSLSKCKFPVKKTTLPLHLLQFSTWGDRLGPGGQSRDGPG